MVGARVSDGGASTDLLCHQKPSSLQREALLSCEEKAVVLLSHLGLFKAHS